MVRTIRWRGTAGRRWGRVSKTLVVLGSLAAVAVVAIVLLTVWFTHWLDEPQRKLQAELALLQAAGEPTTPGELHAMYAVSEGETDSTRLWVQAIAPFDTPAFQADVDGVPIVGIDLFIPPPGEEWSELAAAEQLLKKYEQTLQRLHAAADSGGAVVYPVQFSAGFGTLLPHVQKVRVAGRLLALEAHVRAHQGDAAGAADAIRATLRASESLEREPVALSQLVRLAVAGLGADTLRQLLPSAGFSNADLLRLQQELRQLDYHNSLRRALLGERVLALQELRNLRSQTPFGLGKHDEAFYLQTVNRIVAASQRPWPQCYEEVQVVEATIQSEANSGGWMANRRTMSLQLLPTLEAFFAATARGMVSRDATDVLIAAELYRRQHGELPAQLSELVPRYLPQAPLDPFSGGPLRYTLRDGTPLVYSVGENRSDEGGRQDQPGDPDLVFP